MTQEAQTRQLQPVFKEIEESWRGFIDELKSVPPDDWAANPGDGEWSVRGGRLPATTEVRLSAEALSLLVYVR